LLRDDPVVVLPVVPPEVALPAVPPDIELPVPELMPPLAPPAFPPDPPPLWAMTGRAKAADSRRAAPM